jgi:hypothetical protein
VGKSVMALLVADIFQGNCNLQQLSFVSRNNSRKLINTIAFGLALWNSIYGSTQIVDKIST